MVRSRTAVVVGLLGLQQTVDAFGVAPRAIVSSVRRSLTLAANAADLESCGCDTVSTATEPSAFMMNDVAVTASGLRSMELTDVGGRRVAASTAIGDQGKAVVVFLRHLG